MIAESGGRREDRQKMILEGWRDAVQSGRYAAVYYDCASSSVARWISRLAKKIWLTASEFHAAVQMNAEEIAALAPAAAEDEQAVHDQQCGSDTGPARQKAASTRPVRSVALTEPVSMQLEMPEAPPAPQPQTAEAVEARERVYREIFGLTELKAGRSRR